MNAHDAGRRSIRLREVSYAEAGWYFVTICTTDRECTLGDVAEGEIRLTEVGRIVHEEWERTPALRPYVELDAFVVMPNHVHGVIGIVGDASYGGDGDRGDGCRGAARCAPTGGEEVDWSGVRVNVVAGSLGAIVRGFKAAVTKRVNEMRGTPSATLWQRNYYEHIVRGPRDLDRIRRYIEENPRRWVEDRYYQGP